ncbi:arrestin domain-containing protein 17 [Drosophila ficusphila]|uniref:arrestin domain-containing protein 17 n=1 Tax=Drosophila ficusphila TaxID=30025 RepID=UPI0007E618EC|nr:arrestin domain-containing protein 17 [Drosophila ficusphila]
MAINCEFYLSRAAAVYYTGEQISGSVTVTVDGKKPFPLEGVNITLHGLSSVHWRESLRGLPEIEHNDSSGQLESVKVDYSGSKVHINQTKKLTDELCLQPGAFQLGEFSFELPKILPATCSLPYGNIEYSLKVVIERKGKHNKCFQQRLVIKKRLEFIDLKPQFKETSNTRLNLPRSVFVPGQSIRYEIESKDGVLEFVTRLCKKTSYTSSEPNKKTKTVIEVLSESSDLKNDLRLPLTAPIMSHSDQLEPIDISYYIETFNYLDPPIKLTIFVGSVAPPVDSPMESSRLCFVNLALSQSELFRPINQFLAHSCSREIGAMALNKHCERIKLLKGPKRKRSYVQLAFRYLYKKVLT